MIIKTDNNANQIQDALSKGYIVSVETNFCGSLDTYLALKENGFNCQCCYDDDTKIAMFCMMEDENFIRFSNYFNAFHSNVGVERIYDFDEHMNALGYDLDDSEVGSVYSSIGVIKGLLVIP